MLQPDHPHNKNSTGLHYMEILEKEKYCSFAASITTLEVFKIALACVLMDSLQVLAISIVFTSTPPVNQGAPVFLDHGEDSLKQLCQLSGLFPHSKGHRVHKYMC